MADPDWLTRAKAEGRVSLDRKANPAALPGIEPCEPGTVFEAVFPYPPTLNTYWRHMIMPGGPGRKPWIKVYISKEGEAFKEEVIRLVGRVKPMYGPLSVSITYNPPDKRARDIDNLQKALLDSMQTAGVYKNDSQFREVFLTFGPVVHGGRTTVRIVPLGEAS